MYSINIKNYILLIVLFFLQLASISQASEVFRTVILDPGHGGRDGGAAHFGIREKDVNLDVAQRVEQMLRARGISTAMTRRTDTFVSPDARAALANRYRDAIFVSIHFNGSTDRAAHGVESFYYSTKGVSLATSIHSRLRSRSGAKDRGVKRMPYAVLTKTSCTSMLVECGFLSNSAENKRCASPSYRQTVAQAIADGISAHKK